MEEAFGDIKALRLHEKGGKRHDVPARHTGRPRPATPTSRRAGPSAQIAEHASPKTTKLYDRTADTVTVDEIERIMI